MYKMLYTHNRVSIFSCFRKKNLQNVFLRFISTELTLLIKYNMLF